MKIAYVYDAIYPYVKGGVEKRIYEISRRLAERGHEVHWIVIKWWNGDKTRNQNGICLHGICKSQELYFSGKRSIAEALDFASKVLYALRGDFDVVDCQAFPYFPCFSAKFHSLRERYKLVVTWHEVWGNYWYEYLGRKGFLGKITERLAARLTHWNVAVSERTRTELEQIGLKGVRVIPNGIDFWNIQKVRASNEKSDVIFAGRLVKEKNVEVLIKAINLMQEEFPNIKCVVIGDGPERRKLENLVASSKADKNVKFTGFLENHDEVISYEKSSKVFVLPSTREGFSIAALEANACGLPVVTVDHPMNAACSLIDDDNGFVCKLTAEDVARKIVSAIDRWKNTAKRFVEKTKMYDWDTTSLMVESLYEEVK